MRRSSPTYPLGEIQRLVAQGHPVGAVTQTARDNAARLGFGLSDVVEAVLSLRREDFYKSMVAEKRPGQWQDVYHLDHERVPLYIKLQLTAGHGVVIQFKERRGRSR